ncbi:putative heavy metal-associated domain, HMA [Lupinus albus]|uniref:Putative heavy metal-associated domain, HMA n=1 Tax=Lupinus albus TaxID=3870 RepID=A0A6A4R5B1_LUPAL|nr:putative heavy metal-associated domain, HMA [Lupinus albus]
MKGMNLLCPSTTSTAIAYSMYHRSKPTKNYDHDRRKTQPHVPCSSELPINPKPYLEKHRKSSADKYERSELRRKSSGDEVNDSCTYNLSSVGSSKRYLLCDTNTTLEDWVSESDKIPAMDPSHGDAKTLVNRNNYHALRSCSTRSEDQVVVLRVSFNCRACEGKVRKHISKMEGVTSFSIDRETKKVTIIGNVTPLGVVASVSKVKSAQLWLSPTSSASSSPWST